MAYTGDVPELAVYDRIAAEKAAEKEKAGKESVIPAQANASPASQKFTPAQRALMERTLSGYASPSR